MTYRFYSKEVEDITKEANRRTHEKYPLLEKPIAEWMTKYILEVIKDLYGIVIEEKGERNGAI